MSQYRVGVIGNPVAQSLSPEFQQVAFDAHGIDASYERWHTEEDDLPERVESLREPDAIGANVTIPHKSAACRLVDNLSERATRAGALNTIINRDGTLVGDNTDVPGFLVPLQEREFPFTEANVVVLGAGGAARGVVVALLEAGCARIVVANRTIARAQALRDDLSSRVEVVSLDRDLDVELASASLLVNSTAMGWNEDDLPLSLEQLERLQSTAIVYDLTYQPTAFQRIAAERGHETIDGLPMLVHQGAESFRLWTGKEPPLDAMWEAALAARSARAG